MELVVALAALGVCAGALAVVARMHLDTVALLRDTMATSTFNLTRVHDSVGDVASRTATAIGEAVAASMNPPAPAVSAREEAYAVARDVVASDYRSFEPDDAAEDPTDRWISPGREDLAVVGATDRNPTGLPGFAFDLPLETIDYSDIGRTNGS